MEWFGILLTRWNFLKFLDFMDFLLRFLGFSEGKITSQNGVGNSSLSRFFYFLFSFYSSFLICIETIENLGSLSLISNET